MALGLYKNIMMKNLKKKKWLYLAAAVATGLGIYSIAGKKISLPKKKSSREEKLIRVNRCSSEA